MPNYDSFDIPELNRIGAMMADLAPPTAPRPAASTPRPAARPAPRPTARRAARLGGTPLAAFLDAVNWANAAGFQSALAPARGPRLGALSLATVAAGVNWANAPDGPRLLVAGADNPVDQAPLSIENFLNEFQWD